MTTLDSIRMPGLTAAILLLAGAPGCLGGSGGGSKPDSDDTAEYPSTEVPGDPESGDTDAPDDPDDIEGLARFRDASDAQIRQAIMVALQEPARDIDSLLLILEGDASSPVSYQYPCVELEESEELTTIVSDDCWLYDTEYQDGKIQFSGWEFGEIPLASQVYIEFFAFTGETQNGIVVQDDDTGSYYLDGGLLAVPNDDGSGYRFTGDITSDSDAFEWIPERQVWEMDCVQYGPEAARCTYAAGSWANIDGLGIFETDGWFDRDRDNYESHSSVILRGVDELRAVVPHWPVINCIDVTIDGVAREICD